MVEQNNLPNGKNTWKMVLYERSGYSDNYTDPQVWKSVQRNKHIKPIDFRSAAIKSTRLSSQISVTLIFWIVFLQLHENNPLWIVTYGFFSSLIFLAYVISFQCKNILPVLINVVFFICLGYVCTPVLKTLTDTISTDTIYVMGIILTLIHIAFHQYGMDGVCVSPYVSLNAAICGAICLASRLQETTKAFALLTLAIQAFVLFPKVYETLNFSIVIFVILIIGALSCTILISSTIAILFVFTVLLVNIAFPFGFVWAQKYKDNIYGPWDTAMVFNR